LFAHSKISSWNPYTVPRPKAAVCNASEELLENSIFGSTYCMLSAVLLLQRNVKKRNASKRMLTKDLQAIGSNAKVLFKKAG
jgi:hypothetical protein